MANWAKQKTEHRKGRRAYSRAPDPAAVGSIAGKRTSARWPKWNRASIPVLSESMFHQQQLEDDPLNHQQLPACKLILADAWMVSSIAISNLISRCEVLWQLQGKKKSFPRKKHACIMSLIEMKAVQALLSQACLAYQLRYIREWVELCVSNVKILVMILWLSVYQLRSQL